MMKQLHHRGVLVPPQYEGRNLTIKVKEEENMLTPIQEEMAIAWTKKIGTPYVEDRTFAKNFHDSLSEKLGITVKPGDVDYSNLLKIVEEERAIKANLSKEAKKQLASRRKAQRETNKENYGYAWVDGEKMEIGNYTVEPSSIFLGRGRHPLRGRWKEGPRESDIELNLSPDAPRPTGNWKTITWQPDSLWIARWKDKLTGKLKYVWLSDSSILKQRKDIEKFEKAKELNRKLRQVQRHIARNLESDSLKRRKTATVCYLIDKLKIRVGDEKDPDEADTVGASTLRPEHLQFDATGTVTFSFLGKDSVPHVFTVKLGEKAVQNLKQFAENARSTLFEGVNSKEVSEFLDEVMTGLSAKVFRTHYASDVVNTKLEKLVVEPTDPSFLKKHVATMANLEAAKICNHRRTVPKTWKSSLEKKKIRLQGLKTKSKRIQRELRKRKKNLEETHKNRLQKQEERLSVMSEKLRSYKKQLQDRRLQDKSVVEVQRRIQRQKEAIVRQKQRIKRMKDKYTEQREKLRQRFEAQEQRQKTASEKLQIQIKAQSETRDYNLATSLKSYIDPRIYYEWGKEVDYDWKQYYSKTLQSKFSWVETEKN